MSIGPKSSTVRWNRFDPGKCKSKLTCYSLSNSIHIAERRVGAKPGSLPIGQYFGSDQPFSRRQTHVPPRVSDNDLCDNQRPLLSTDDRISPGWISGQPNGTKERNVLLGCPCPSISVQIHDVLSCILGF